MPLTTAPITLGDRVWITADVFVAPGVTIGDGVVVTARSSVFHDIEPWTVVSGNPARFVKPRQFILLCGGDKSSQAADIKRAKAFWSEWKRRQT